MPADSYARIYVTSGKLLSTVQFHTSCSVPIVLGDHHGSLKVTGFANTNGFTQSDCCSTAKKVTTVPAVTTVPVVTTVPATCEDGACDIGIKGGKEGKTGKTGMSSKGKSKATLLTLQYAGNHDDYQPQALNIEGAPTFELKTKFQRKKYGN